MASWCGKTIRNMKLSGLEKKGFPKLFSNDANHSKTKTSWLIRYWHQVLGNRYLRMFSEHAWMKCPLDDKIHQITLIKMMYMIYLRVPKTMLFFSNPVWLLCPKFSFQATVQLPFEACLRHWMWLFDRPACAFGGGNLWFWPFRVPGWIHTSVIFWGEFGNQESFAKLFLQSKTIFNH